MYATAPSPAHAHGSHARAFRALATAAFWQASARASHVATTSTVARVVTFTAIVVLTPLAYLAAWILMPKDDEPTPA